MIARLKSPSGPPNAVIAKGRNRGKTLNAIVALENVLTSLPFDRKFYITVIFFSGIFFGITLHSLYCKYFSAEILWFTLS